MNAVVTNDNSFTKGVTLTIKDGVLVWSVNHLVKRSTFNLLDQMPQFATELMNPYGSINDFVKLLTLVFEFTGVITNEYNSDVPDVLKISSNEKLTQWDIVKHIYNTPLEHKIKFVHESHRPCDMGYCNTLMGIDIDKTEYKTYGDVMNTLAFDGIYDNNDNGPYWVYPAGVLLNLEKYK